MRKCAVCGKEFDKYVPIDRKYIDLPKQYGRTRETRSELLNREEYSCPYCYTPDRDRMIVLFLKRCVPARIRELIFWKSHRPVHCNAICTRNGDRATSIRQICLWREWTIRQIFKI